MGSVGLVKSGQIGSKRYSQVSLVELGLVELGLGDRFLALIRNLNFIYFISVLP
jgi:hypothetical protein